jgi:1-acyl-sn-glycerol-3-phosphate acyltransferase
VAQVISLQDRQRPEAGGCQALTKSGKRCRNRATGDYGFCAIHLPERPERIGPFSAEAVQAFLDFLRDRLTGNYEVDEFGFDRELTERFWPPLLKPIGQYYWRVDWRGLENIPSEGAALLVSNHAGTLPVDAMVMKFGVLAEHHARRHVRLLAADLAFRMPFVGPMARKMGNTLATQEDARRLLEAGELVGVFPEGYKGVGKGWRERYRLQRFGRGGFIELALRARVPVVPVAIVGSEEIYPMIADVKLLARLFGLPYFPITPLFPLAGPAGMVPLPSKWHIQFGEPIETADYDETAAEDPMVTFELTDQVRETIQQTLYQLLANRRNMFLG